jgi:hypothetical protein
MTFMFHIYCSQELFQSTEKVYNEINQISSIFPNSAFLQTQRALLHYHSKGEGLHAHHHILPLIDFTYRIRRGRWLVCRPSFATSLPTRFNGLILEHPLCHAITAEASTSRLRRISHRQVPTRNLLHHRKLLLAMLRARKGSHVLPSSFNSRPPIPLRLDANGPRIHRT